MVLAHRWGARNLSKIELIVVILIFVIIIGVFSRYMLQVFSRAEQSMVNTSVMYINTALHYQAALAIMRNEYEKIELLKKINPLEDIYSNSDTSDFSEKLNNVLLKTVVVVKPTNYGGIYYPNQITSLEKGQWYFDLEENLVIYIIRNDEFFDSELEGPSRLRFRIILDYDDLNANNQFEPDIDKFKTMGMVTIDDYQWVN